MDESRDIYHHYSKIMNGENKLNKSYYLC